MPYVSLHNQTTYSLLDSLCNVKDLFKKAKELNQNAIAITDHGSLAATWEAFKISKEIGIKFIVGCEFYFVDNAKNIDDKFRHIILIAKNAIGYKNLLTLNKKSFDQGKNTGSKVYPVLDWSLLESHSDGLICLTACGNGIISQLISVGKPQEAEQALLRLKKIFGDNLGIEVLANNMKRGATLYSAEIDQKFLNKQLINLSKKHNIKAIATSNTHYINKSEYNTHDVLLAIGSKQPIHSNFRLKYPVPEFYLKSEEEMLSFFSRNYSDLAQELIDNTQYFANLCEDPEWIDPKYSNPTGKELPIFPIKEELDYNDYLTWLSVQESEIQNLSEDKSYLRYKCFYYLNQYIKDNNIQEDNKQIYIDRIYEELEVLEFHGFSSYMLIVADYLNWARKNNIALGLGRGSVGGSFIAYLLNIHNADPIKYNLIFARFHNKDKTAYPDIDVDIAPSGRDKVHNYIKNKYGNECVAHVSNVNRITPKVYVRDIARACELGGSKEAAVKIGNDVADCIPSDVHSIDLAYEKIPLFTEYCKKYPEFIKHKQICNQYRAWSTHAGGIIIAARSLIGLVPLRVDKDGAVAVEYDKDKSEENGLVKMDTLGLSTLDIISKTNEIILENGKEIPNINYNEYDQIAYDLVSKGDTLGVFQFGTSAGTIDLCKKIKPKTIDDLSHINALARPSARDMRQDFIDTKNGKKQPILLHENLKRAFQNTFGFGLYEESLMFLAQDIAGWSLYEADKLRKLTKAKGKYPEKVIQWRKEFIEGAIKNNVDKVIATRIWDEIIELFQGYGFNASHSILYSMMSYQTAYYKAHFPIEFLLANLMFEVKSNTPSAKINIEKIKKEIRDRKVKILPPDINKSQLSYNLIDNKTLLTGLDALKNVGDDAIIDILNKRPFTSFQDFMSRVSSRLVRSSTIQALAASGALDCFNISRKDMFLYNSDYRKKLTTWKKKHNSETEIFDYPWVKDKDWSLEEKYALEVNYLNEGFICKPHKAYGNFFEDSHVVFKQIKQSNNRQNLMPIKAIIIDSFVFQVKKEDSSFYGQSMAKILLEDKNNDKYSCTIFPDKLSNLIDILKSNKIKEIENGIAISFLGSVNIYEDEVGVILKDIYEIKDKPQLPNDRKQRKVSLRSKDKNEAIRDILEIDINDPMFEEQVKDYLYDENLLDLDEND